MQRNIFQSLRRMCRACICDRSLYHAAIMRFATPGVFLHHGFAIIPSSLACSDPFVKALRSFLSLLAFFSHSFPFALSLFRPTLSLILGLCTIYKYIVSSVPIGLCTLSARKSRRKAIVKRSANLLSSRIFYFLLKYIANSEIEYSRSKKMYRYQNIISVIVFHF